MGPAVRAKLYQELYPIFAQPCAQRVITSLLQGLLRRCCSHLQAQDTVGIPTGNISLPKSHIESSHDIELLFNEMKHFPGTYLRLACDLIYSSDSASATHRLIRR